MGHRLPMGGNIQDGKDTLFPSAVQVSLYWSGGRAIHHPHPVQAGGGCGGRRDTKTKPGDMNGRFKSSHASLLYLQFGANTTPPTRPRSSCCWPTDAPPLAQPANDPVRLWAPSPRQNSLEPISGLSRRPPHNAFPTASPTQLGDGHTRTSNPTTTTTTTTMEHLPPSPLALRCRQGVHCAFHLRTVCRLWRQADCRMANQIGLVPLNDGSRLLHQERKL